MRVGELIELLAKMANNAEICTLGDNGQLDNVDCVWLAKGGCVIMAEVGTIVYEDAYRPIGAPSKAEDSFWRLTPSATEKP